MKIYQGKEKNSKILLINYRVPSLQIDFSISIITLPIEMCTQYHHNNICHRTGHFFSINISFQLSGLLMFFHLSTFSSPHI
jgi:hypothetical protein